MAAKRFVLPGGPWALLAVALGATASAVMLYGFFFGAEMALLRVLLPAHTRLHTGGLLSRLAGVAFYLAPVVLLAGPAFAVRHRVRGATRAKAWRYAGLSTLAALAVFGLGAAAVQLGAMS